MKFEWKPKPRGLKNLKNTCYLNSVLQILSQCEELIQDVTIENTENGSESSEFLIDFFDILKELNSGDEGVVDPQKFIQSSYGALSSFSPCTQQDSLEYLISLFNQLFESFPQKESLFQGLQVTRVICERCNLQLSPQDTYTTLGLSIPQGEGYRIFQLFSKKSTELSLELCISQQFNAPKRVLLHCSACQKETNQYIEETIENLSPYLIIYLKRYSNSRLWSKLSTTIHFPQYIKSSLLNPSDLSYYRLIGLIEHGSYLFGGHYRSYVLRKNSWYQVNDDKVCQVTWERVAEAQAYILLFKKC